MQASLHPLRFAVWLAVPLLAVGCQSLKSEKKDEAIEDSASNPGEMKIPVGTIHMVDPAGRFVLIRSSRTFQVEAGSAMTSYESGGAATARFQVSPARKGAFLTADIVDGAPEKGEQVLMDYRQPSAASPGDVPPGVDSGSEVQVLE
ncbi:MAG: hypothetical protein WD342_16460 [Verrucomicrobiales bacterium]